MNDTTQINTSIDSVKDLLLSNKGFENVLDKWIPLASRYDLKKVPSVWRKSCPFCSCKQHNVVGQYLYYSNLIRLQSCQECSLLYSDVLIDDDFLFKHFEKAYKDEDYFKFERNEIFSEICDLLEASLPKGAEVLDVGGATGVFAEMLKLKRPDVSITISDISSTACDDSRARGFEAVQSSLSNLDLDKQFDLVLLLDVLYYEKDLNRAFTSLDKHLKRGGKILYRGPNKSFLIKIDAFFKRNKKTTNVLRAFNPEHIYVLTQKFLFRALSEASYSEILVIPSSALGQKKFCMKMYKTIINYFSSIFFRISGKVISPSFIMIARKP